MSTTPILLVVPLRHKAGGKAHLVADFLDPRLEQHSLIGSSSGTGITQVHLIHAWAVLTVVPFDIDPIVAHHTGHAPQQVIVGTRLADGVAVHTRIEWRQVRPKVLVTQRYHILAEEARLQLSRSHGFIAHGTSTFLDIVEDVTRR